MGSRPTARQTTFHFLGSTHGGRLEYTGGCDYALITITPAVAWRLLGRMRAFAMLHERFPDLCWLVEYDVTPCILSTCTVAMIGLDSAEEWQLLSGRQASALKRLTKEEEEPPRPEGLSAHFDSENMFWSMAVPYTDVVIDTPSIARASLEYFAGRG